MARSHGGGSRSSSSRSSSSRSSSFGSGRSSFGGSARRHVSHSTPSRGHISHSSHRPRPHHSGGIHIHTTRYYGGSSFSGDYYGSSIHMNPYIGALVAIIFFAIFALAIIIGISSSIKVSNNTKEDISISFNHYQSMITYAESHPDHKVVGTIIDINYDYDLDAYYIVYSFEDPNSYFDIEHESFAMYSLADTMNMQVGDPIDIAIDCPANMIDRFTTDSINMDYKNVSISDDPEIIYINKRIRSYQIFRVIAILVEVGLAVGFVAVCKKMKKYNQEQKETSNTTSTTTSNTKYCSYCGSKLPDGTSKCPLCGASNNKDS